MEPLNDHELHELLGQWQAPPAPARLDARVLGSDSRSGWWHWLVSGSIRIPVPVGIVVVMILVFSVYWGVTARRTVERPARTVTLADFQPVKELQPRIVRSGYEGQ
jgi:hypothetical protein